MNIRPIDANALFKKLRKHQTFDYMIYAWVALKEAPTLSLNTLRDEIYQDAVDHGLWEDYDQRQIRNSDFCEKYTQYAFDLDVEGRNECALCICRECIELREARDDVDAFTEELVDVVIMCFSVAGKLGIDIDAAIRRKMEINKGRSWKHKEE